MKLASTQEGRNRKLFKAGKVSIIMDTIPAFLHIMLDLLGFLYPFRSISAIWVEICERGNLESLPFSTDLRCLGRDFQPATTGISTLLAGLRCLGREIRPAATGISTFLYDFRCLGRDLRTAALGISTLFTDFMLFG